MARGMGTVVIATEREGHARLDRNTLKSLGAAEVVTFESGRAALEYLAKAPVDLVISDWRLTDMSGCEFARRVRDKAGADRTPVVMAALENHEQAVLEAVAAGCAGYVLRPYSLDAFERQVRQARMSCLLPGVIDLMLAKARMLRGSGEVGRAAATLARARQASPSRQLFDSGRQALAEGRFEAAIAAFNRAVAINKAFAEAYEGLAGALQGRGEASRAMHCLQKAAQLYAEQDRFTEVKSVYAEIQSGGGRMRNPFLCLGLKLWKRQLYREAILAWRRAAKLTPGDERVVCTLGKGLAVLGQGEAAQLFLAATLEAHPGLRQVRSLLAQLRRGDAPESRGLWSWLRNGLASVRRALSLRLEDKAA
jgi:CheY-like chemotaxis protein